MAFDWKATLGVVAPSLATALGGPLAGMATKEILSVLGLGDGASEAEIAKAVAGMTPEQALAMKQADNAFAIRMRELDIELDKLVFSDRDSARVREAAVRDHTPKALGAIIIAGFIGTVYMVLAGHVEGLKDPLTATLIGTLIGYVSAKADQVVAYYFGSNSSSERKTELLAKSTPSK